MDLGWTQALAIILTTLFSTLGMGWAMFYFLSSKIEKIDEKLADRTREIIKEIRDSNLDFHGRLAKLEGKRGE
jgi:hypothetical protein